MASDEEMVTFRLAPADRRAIQRLIEAGEFRNRSDFLRYAVKSTLAAHTPVEKLDLTLEGVDLPATHAQTRAPSRSRSKTPGVNL